MCIFLGVQRPVFNVSTFLAAFIYIYAAVVAVQYRFDKKGLVRE